MSTNERAARVYILACVAATALATACLSGGDDDDDGGGAVSANDGAGSPSSSECASCTEASCSSQRSACDDSGGCGDVVDCLLACDRTDTNCQLDCANQASNLSQDALMAGNQLQMCLGTSCAAQCWSTEVATGAGANGAGVPAGANGGSGSLATGECQDCSDASCNSQRSACDGASGCGETIDCVLGCDPADNDCLVDCANAAANLSVDAQQAGANYSACLVTSCTGECFGTSAGSDIEPTTPALPNGGSTPSEPTTPSNGGSTPSSPAPVDDGSQGVSWLVFDGDWADLSVAPNSELNISGALYAYGDSCATVNWDPATRCVYGELCEPGSDFANWGVAVGFDFHNTGEEGSPPNAKLTWDPTAVGATGVTWRISGSAPGLQAWLTNMDPSFDGVCTADTCEIAGPPDGESNASTSGELYFDQLEKDDWGGSGVSYRFDPSATLSLQFKLPAISTGATSYDFCVDELGIIVP